MSYALITGASKGIGKVIALELAAKGYPLIIVARDESLLNLVAAEISGTAKVDVKVLALDLSLPSAPEEVFNFTQKNGLTVSVLVNNAGYGLSGPFDRYSTTDHLAMLQVNCNSLVALCHLFLPQLKLQPKAFILNIASSAAYQAVPYLSLYAASKSLVLSFSRGLRYELRKTSVSVTCVCPGSTDTDFATTAQVGEKAMKTAQKVNMTPEQVGKAAVAAMVAGKAEVITGAINKLGGFLTWLLPKSILEGGAARLYE